MTLKQAVASFLAYEPTGESTSGGYALGWKTAQALLVSLIEKENTLNNIDSIYVGIIVDEDGCPKVHGWSPSPEAFENGPAHVTVVCLDRAKRIREIPMSENGVSLEAFVAEPVAGA